MFWPFLLLIVVLLALVAAFSGRDVHLPMMGCMGGHQDMPANGQPTALDIAKERYARGEIEKEQFEEIRRNLASS